MSNSGSTLIDAVNAAYPAMSQLYASDWYVAEAANEGYYVQSGCAITASGTAGKVDMSQGAILAGTTELAVASVTAASTTITSLADVTNPKWVALEVDSSGTLNFNQGTAAANPEKPTPTSSRVVVAWLYVPANATAVDALTSSTNGKAKIIDARILRTGSSSTLGWISYSDVTPTTGTFDAPSYPIVFAGVDLTGTLQAGDKVKITQSTDKFFIVTNVSFSTDTTVTLYGGTDYTLVASGTTAITGFWYSRARSPRGFPTSIAKWTETFTDTSSRLQASPVSGTVYNPGSLSMNVPIGAWRLKWEATCEIQSAAAQTLINGYFELSTSASAVSDALLKANLVIGGASGGLLLMQVAGRTKQVTLTTKQTYYLICMTNLGSVANIGFRNDLTNAKVMAECTYL